MATPLKEGPCRYLTSDVFPIIENLPGHGKVVIKYPGCSFPCAGGSSKDSCIFAQRQILPTESGCGFAQSMVSDVTQKRSIQDADGFDA